MVHERQSEAAVATVLWPTRACFRTGRRVSDRGSGCGLPPPERRHGSELWRRTWLVLPPERSLRNTPQLVTANHTKRSCFIAFSWPSASSPHLCPVAILSIRDSCLNPVNWLLRLLFPAPQATPWRNIAFDLCSALSCCLHARRGVSPKQQRIAHRFQRRQPSSPPALPYPHR